MHCSHFNYVDRNVTVSGHGWFRDNLLFYGEHTEFDDWTKEEIVQQGWFFELKNVTILKQGLRVYNGTRTVIEVGLFDVNSTERPMAYLAHGKKLEFDTLIPSDQLDSLQPVIAIAPSYFFDERGNVVISSQTICITALILRKVAGFLGVHLIEHISKHLRPVARVTYEFV